MAAEQYASSGSLASSVLELTQMLTKNNQELKERKDEKVRLCWTWQTGWPSAAAHHCATRHARRCPTRRGGVGRVQRVHHGVHGAARGGGHRTAHAARISMPGTIFIYY